MGKLSLLSKNNLLFFIYLVGAIFYFGWRIYFTLGWHTILAPAMLIADLIMVINGVIFLYTTRKVHAPAEVHPLIGKSVDILIPTYNEPKRIVLGTVRAALRVRGRRDVFVLDDGNRKELKSLVEGLGARYLARGDNRHAKAGNMNFGLKYSNSEFVAFFDCDHVPLPSFIEETLGYFNDSELGFVQTPQTFYNLDSIQHRRTKKRPLWNEQTMFYEAIQPAKNSFNAAFFCGTSALLRRKAIDSVGGFSEGTATEDIHTSIRIHAKGWKSLFVPKKLAFGLAPEDMQEYHQQRARWGAGSLGLLFRSKDSPFVIRGLTFNQRLTYFHSMIAHMMGLYKFLYILMPIITIFFIQTVPSVSLASYFIVHIIFVVFSYYIVMQFSLGTFHFPFTEQFDIFNILPQIESLKGIFKVNKKFRVSLKAKIKKSNSFAFTFFGTLFILTIFANSYGIALIQRGGNSSLYIALIWNALNAFFLSTILYYLVGRSFRKPLNIIPHNLQIFVQASPRRPAQICTMNMRDGLIKIPVESLKPNIELFLPEAWGNLRINANRTKIIRIGSKQAMAIYSFKPRNELERAALQNYFFEKVVAGYIKSEEEQLPTSAAAAAETTT